MPAKLTNEIVDDRLRSRPIIRLDNYVTSKTKIKWKCIDCGNTWSAIPNSIFQGRGCAVCAGNAKKTPEEYNLEIKDRSLTALEPYINARIKLKHQCKICGNVCEALPRSILQGHGCPFCGTVATQIHYKGKRSEALKLAAREIPCSLYIAKHKACYKVGISSNVSNRIKELNREGFDCTLYKEFKSNTWDAIMLEAKIRNMFPAYDLQVKFGGHTELYHKEDLQQIEELIDE